MPPWEAPENSIFGINLRFNGDWYYKNTNIRRMDLSNLEKVVCDAVSENYGFDDARIFEKYSWKVQNREKSFVQVSLYRLCGDGLVDTGAGRGEQETA